MGAEGSAGPPALQGIHSGIIHILIIVRLTLNVMTDLCVFLQGELQSISRLTVLEGSVEDLLVAEPNPDEPGSHRVTGISLGMQHTHMTLESESG